MVPPNLGPAHLDPKLSILNDSGRVNHYVGRPMGWSPRIRASLISELQDLLSPYFSRPLSGREFPEEETMTIETMKGESFKTPQIKITLSNGSTFEILESSRTPGRLTAYSNNLNNRIIVFPIATSVVGLETGGNE